ncbi:MAG TPA: Crp/Fnr family transcriptional regulator [Rhizomicrobium sp.]|nr:Crp/Fnr family transcriptional regulator [Rhizomicrobium sp.]
MTGALTLGQPVSMTDAPQRAGIRNRLLSKLAPSDWGLLAPHLEPVTLRERQVIEVPQKPIAHAYFLEIGVASVVAVDNEDHRIEVGVIGYEGVTGVPLIMGDTRAQHSTYMQIPGSGHRIGADRLRAAIAESESLRALMLKSAQGFMIQTAQTALANGRAKLEERLARWLLMAHDRMTTNAVPLTHEFLAVMLGVRRAGVTVAIHSFEQRGFITTRRGELTMVNRKGIEQVAGSFYGTPEAELERLLTNG